jgi:hypothetical protein
VREDREQPALGVGAPPVDDREEGDRSGRRSRLVARLGPDGLELAAIGVVDDVPAAVAKLLANRVGGLKIALTTALDALVKKALSLVPIRASWL